VVHPDYTTTRMLPWLPGTVMVIGDVTDEGGTPVDV
jgi:glutamine synthetase